jgi:hypothetical protein
MRQARFQGTMLSVKLAGGDRTLQGSLSANLHRLKRGLGGAASTRVDPASGDVCRKDTGEKIGNIYDG